MVRGIRSLMYISLLAGLCAAGQAYAADAYVNGDLREEYVRSVKAKPPKVVYFEGEMDDVNLNKEARRLNRIAPSAKADGFYDAGNARTGSAAIKHIQCHWRRTQRIQVMPQPLAQRL